MNLLSGWFRFALFSLFDGKANIRKVGDIPGQLYRITQTLADFGINIHKAFIATEVGQLIDVFYVLDKKGNKVDDDGFLKEIVNGLMHAIGADEAGDK